MNDRSVTSEERAELDETYRGYSGNYGRRWSLDNPGNRLILAERARLVRALLRDAGHLECLRGTVLDVGAGSGETFPGLVAPAGTLLRLDLLLARLEVARAADRAALLVCGDGARLPLPDDSCDLVFLGTVLSSVRSADLRRAIVHDAGRVVRSGGAIVCYDFRIANPRNASTVPIRRSELRSLLPGAPLRWRSLTLAPPLARRLGRWAPRLYPMLAALPPLRTHSLAVWSVR